MCTLRWQDVPFPLFCGTFTLESLFYFIFLHHLLSYFFAPLYNINSVLIVPQFSSITLSRSPFVLFVHNFNFKYKELLFLKPLLRICQYDASSHLNTLVYSSYK